MKRFVKYANNDMLCLASHIDYIYFNSKKLYDVYKNGKKVLSNYTLHTVRSWIRKGWLIEKGIVERKNKPVSAKPLVLPNATVTVENKTQDAPYKSKPFVKYQRVGGDFIHGGYYFTNGLEWFSCDRNEKVENVTNIGFDFSDKNIGLLVNMNLWEETILVPKHIKDKSVQVATMQPAKSNLIKPFRLYYNNVIKAQGFQGYYYDNNGWKELTNDNVIKDAEKLYPVFNWDMEQIPSTWIDGGPVPDWVKMGISSDKKYLFASSIAISIRSGATVISGGMYKRAKLINKPDNEQVSVTDGMIMFQFD